MAHSEVEPEFRVAAPWPFWRAKVAAKALGVDVELLNGLANTPKLRAFKSYGRSGAVVWLFNRDDIRALSATITQAR